MISVEHLTKCYGDFTAVKDLSFEINEGHVYGFLGPNGAGKSTTLNIITGCLSATQGSVKIGGYDIFEEPDKAKKLIGYLPEQPPLYLNETPVEYLKFVGEAKGLKGTELKEQIEEVIERTKIADVKNRCISALSKGYKQRVGIAQALLGKPKVIILDEPTVGLDPIQIIEIRDLIKELGQTHTVIFSSHILSEVQAICDQVLIIAKGKLVAFDETENLKNLMTSSNEIIITADANEDEVRNILSDINYITNINMKGKKEGYPAAHIKTDHENMYEVSRAIFSAFAKNKKALLEMSLKKANLEDIFIELMETSKEDSEMTNDEKKTDQEKNIKQEENKDIKENNDEKDSHDKKDKKDTKDKKEKKAKSKSQTGSKEANE